MPGDTKTGAAARKVTRHTTAAHRKLVAKMRQWQGQHISDLREAQLRMREAANALEAALDLCDHLREGLEQIATVDCLPWGTDSVDFGVCEGRDELSKVARETLGWPDRPRCKDCGTPVERGKRCVGGCR